MIKRTYQQKGIEYAGELAFQNLKDLYEILKWNKKNGITLFRMSSDIFPWMSEYEFEELPQYKKVKNILNVIGNFVLENSMRITFHPGPFNVLCSPNESVVEKSFNDLRKHSEIMNMMGLPETFEYPINIHVGGAYGDRIASLGRFVENWKRLPETVQKRLVIENDDKASMYSVPLLHEHLHKTIGIPITFDGHHQRCYGRWNEYEEDLKLALSTWKVYGVRPLTHYSSSSKVYENSETKVQTHADYIYETIPTFGEDFDVELEAKSKDFALIEYRKNNEKLLEGKLHELREFCS